MRIYNNLPEFGAHMKLMLPMNGWPLCVASARAERRDEIVEIGQSKVLSISCCLDSVMKLVSVRKHVFWFALTGRDASLTTTPKSHAIFFVFQAPQDLRNGQVPPVFGRAVTRPKPQRLSVHRIFP